MAETSDSSSNISTQTDKKADGLLSKVAGVKMSSWSRLWALLRQPENKDTLRNLILTTICMVLLPLGCFYGCFNYILPKVGIVDESTKLIYSGMISVFAVNIVAIAYVLMAFSGEVPNVKQKRHDE